MRYERGRKDAEAFLMTIGELKRKRLKWESSYIITLISSYSCTKARTSFYGKQLNVSDSFQCNS